MAEHFESPVALPYVMAGNALQTLHDQMTFSVYLDHSPKANYKTPHSWFAPWTSARQHLAHPVDWNVSAIANPRSKTMSKHLKYDSIWSLHYQTPKLPTAMIVAMKRQLQSHASTPSISLVRWSSLCATCSRIRFLSASSSKRQQQYL